MIHGWTIYACGRGCGPIGPLDPEGNINSFPKPTVNDLLQL